MNLKQTILEYSGVKETINEVFVDGDLLYNDNKAQIDISKSNTTYNKQLKVAIEKIKSLNPNNKTFYLRVDQKNPSIWKYTPLTDLESYNSTLINSLKKSQWKTINLAAEEKPAVASDYTEKVKGVQFRQGPVIN